MFRLGLISATLSVLVFVSRVQADWQFVRGDVNDDAAVEVSDAVSLLAYLFVPGTVPPSCFDAVDVNDDGALEISDAVFLLSYLFIPGSGAPAAPFPGCGDDITEDVLDCLGPLSGCSAPSGPPTITSTPPLDAVEAALYTYDVDASDPDSTQSLDYSFDESPVGATIDSTTGFISWTPSATQTGSQSFTVRVTDDEDPPFSVTQSFTVSVVDIDQPPVFTSTPPSSATVYAPFSYRPSAIDPDTAGTPVYSLVVAPSGATFDAASGTVTWTPTPGQVGVHSFQVTAELGGVEGPQAFGVEVFASDAMPPDPASLANSIDATIASTLLDNVAFLFASDPPVQRGVSVDTIERHRAAVIRGRVDERDGGPLGGVLVTVRGHAEFGSTVTRANGEFDLVVNGGGRLTLSLRRTGFAIAERLIDVRWNGFEFSEPVALVPLDDHVTTIDLASSSMQVAQGTMQVDADGERCATLLFPAGVEAVMWLDDGSSTPLSTLSVRATEYTVGDEGPTAMPASLPHHTAYTYCVELSVDEAEAEGATRVEFDVDLPVYVENFLEIPTGTTVPSAHYDRRHSRWVRQSSGRVIEILSEAGGSVTVDLDGDGIAEDASAVAAFGITPGELEMLATLYDAGQSLWRMPTRHFSPHDYNFPYECDGCDAPGGGSEGPDHRGHGDPCEQNGYSTLFVQNQALGESIPVRGTPYALNYRSDRVIGRLDDYTLRVPLSASAFAPPGAGVYLGTRVRISVAGRRFSFDYPWADAAALGYQMMFTWDGLDAYGRRLQGAQRASVAIGYEYEATYLESSEWAVPPAVIGGALVPGRFPLVRWRSEAVELGDFDATEADFAGWNFDVHHHYDPQHERIHLGSGESYASDALGQEIALARYQFAEVCATAPDGSFYFVVNSHQLRRAFPDGSEVVVAGDSTSGFSGDGGSAVDARFNTIRDVALRDDGTLLIADGNNYRIRSIDRDGRVETVAGNGVQGVQGDGELALDAEVSPLRVVADPMGGFYIMSTGRVRYVDPDGVIHRVFGGGTSEYHCTAVLATSIYPLGSGLSDIELSSGGELYVLIDKQCLVRVAADGLLEPVAGGDCPFSYSCGTPAIGEEALGRRLNAIGFNFDLNGSILLACNDSGTQQIRRITTAGTIDVLAGNSVPGCPGLDDAMGPVMDAQIAPTGHIQVGPDGSIYFGHSGCGSGTLRLKPPMPGFSIGDQLLPSRDGSELYRFDRDGRHLETLHALTSEPLLVFEYDDQGRLVGIVGHGDNRTDIERDLDGHPTAIVGPFGRVTTLEVNGDGLLSSVTSPGGETWSNTYVGAGGLLASHADPAGQTSTFGYDALGRLTTDTSSTGQTITLAREEFFAATGFRVTEIFPSGREIVFNHVRFSEGTWNTSIINGGCCTRFETFREWLPTDRTITRADGTVIRRWHRPDPRFRLLAPLVEWRTTTPAGVETVELQSRVVQLTDPDDLLSLESLTHERARNGLVTTVHYDAATRLLTEHTPAGRVRTLEIDTIGRPVESAIGDSAPRTVTYDENGGVVELAEVGLSEIRAQSFAYDALGRMIQSIGADGRVTTFDHVTRDRIATRTDATGTALERTTAFDYDALGRPIAVALPNGTSYGYAWTPSSYLSALIYPDVAGTSADTTYVYDDNRRLASVVEPDGSTVGVARDGEDRIVQITTPSGSTALGYGASTGLLVSIERPSGDVLTLGYDGDLLIEQSWSGLGTVARQIDADLNIVEDSVNGVPVAYVYDADGLLIAAGDLSIERHPARSTPTGSILGATVETYGFDEFGSLSSHTVSTPLGTAYSSSFLRDAVGRVSTQTESVEGGSRVLDYEYDELGRLTRVLEGGVEIESYAYDALDQRLVATIAGVESIATVDERGRVTAFGTIECTYDDAGTRVSRVDSSTGDTTLTSYDLFGRLESVVLPSGDIVEYDLDGFGRRIGKSVGGVRQYSLLYRDRLNPIAMLDGSGAVTHRFIYGTRTNVPDAMIHDGILYRLICDGIGSVRLVVEADTGVVAQRLDYSPYGRVLVDTAPGFQPFGFAGGLYDVDTGLVLFGSRDYDAELGFWASRDLKGLAGGVGLYVYCDGDPINRFDIWGAEPESPDFSFRELGKETAKGFFTGLVDANPGKGAAQGGVGYLTGVGYDWVADEIEDAVEPKLDWAPVTPTPTPDGVPDPTGNPLFDPQDHGPVDPTGFPYGDPLNPPGDGPGGGPAGGPGGGHGGPGGDGSRGGEIIDC